MTAELRQKGHDPDGGVKAGLSDGGVGAGGVRLRRAPRADDKLHIQLGKKIAQAKPLVMGIMEKMRRHHFNDAAAGTADAARRGEHVILIRRAAEVVYVKADPVVHGKASS